MIPYCDYKVIVIMPFVTDVGFWETEFKKQFSELQSPWSWDLRFGSPPTKSRNGWKQFCEIGQVRFRCKQCRRSWSTSRGTAIFHCQPLGYCRGGEVRMESMGQKCKKCALAYERPKWDKEDVSYVVSELLAKVKEAFYGIKSQNKRRRSRNVKTKKTKGPHISRLCEACRRGVCEEIKNLETKNFNIDHKINIEDSEPEEFDSNYDGQKTERTYDGQKTEQTDGFPVHSGNQLNYCVIAVGFVLSIVVLCFLCGLICQWLEVSWLSFAW